MQSDDPQRLQKYLAQLGYGSRREIETWITQGLINVNGKTAELGTKVCSKDHIKIDGKIVTVKHKSTRNIMYHKPVGEICTRKDEQSRPTIFEKLPKLSGQKWIAVGRLDINSSGLILLTTDGEQANKLMHPSANLEREYLVRVLGEISASKLNSLKKLFKKIEITNGTGANVWYKVVLTTGKNREVRNIFADEGLTVNRLIRTRYGKIKLPKSLKPGAFKELENISNAE